MDIKSKFSFSRLLKGAFSIGALFAIIGSIVIGSMQKSIDYTALIFAVIFFGWNIVVIEYVCNNVPRIHISDKGISLNYILKKVFLPWHEIEAIKLTGKSEINFLIHTKKFESGCIVAAKKLYYIPYEFYSNYHELIFRMNIQYNPNDLKKRSNPINESVPRESIKYSDYMILSFEGLKHLLFIIILPLTSLLHFGQSGSPALMIFTVLLFFVFYFLLRTYFNFFIVSNNSIIVKNGLYFWREDEYFFDTIREFVIEKADSKDPIALRIITSDFKHNVYLGASLSKNTWEKLYRHLSEKNISVRIETNLL